VAALLAQGENMQNAPYSPLKSLRLWRNNAGDAGVAAVAHMLTMGPPPPEIPVPPPPKNKPKGKKKGKQKGPTGPPPIPVQLIPLTHVEFMDNSVGPDGCHSLAHALMLGANSSLLTLRLDINPGIGDVGIGELCKGLRTNRTLTVCVFYFFLVLIIFLLEVCLDRSFSPIRFRNYAYHIVTLVLKALGI
jgi:hypothetical protein